MLEMGQIQRTRHRVPWRASPLQELLAKARCQLSDCPALPGRWRPCCHAAGAPLPAGMVSANPKALGPAELSPQGGRVVVALPNQLLRALDGEV